MKNPLTILMADDHPIFRGGLRQIITAERDLKLIYEAGDGEEALRITPNSPWTPFWRDHQSKIGNRQSEIRKLAIGDFQLPQLPIANRQFEMLRFTRPGPFSVMRR